MQFKVVPSQIIRPLFNLESPNFTRKSKPTQCTVTPDMTPQATSGRHLSQFDEKRPKMPPPTVLGRILVARRFAYPPIDGLLVHSDKSKILVNSINPRPFTNIWMNGKALEEVDPIGTSIKEVTIRRAQAYWAIRRMTDHLPCQHCSMDVRAGRWRWSWKGESKRLKQMLHEDAWHIIQRLLN